MNTDMQRYDNIQNFEVFEKTLEPPPAALAVVSLSSYDSLQLVSDAGDHEVLLNSLVAIINENWKLADIKVKEKSDDGPKNLENFKCTDIDLGKSPWGHMAGAATLTAARFLLCPYVTEGCTCTCTLYFCTCMYFCTSKISKVQPGTNLLNMI